MAIELEQSWLAVLGDEFEKDYMLKLKQFLKEEKESGQIIYPKGAIFLMLLTQHHLIK